MPSLSEVCPLVVLEAFTAGVPVLGTQATPFYNELPQLGMPAWSYRFVPLPNEGRFNVDWSELSMNATEARKLAGQLLHFAANWPCPKEEARKALSQKALSAGFDQDTMIASFQKIYESAIAKFFYR